jgi:hypothetical protein
LALSGARFLERLSVGYGEIERSGRSFDPREVQELYNQHDSLQTVEISVNIRPRGDTDEHWEEFARVAAHPASRFWLDSPNDPIQAWRLGDVIRRGVTRATLCVDCDAHESCAGLAHALSESSAEVVSLHFRGVARKRVALEIWSALGCGWRPRELKMTNLRQRCIPRSISWCPEKLTLHFEEADKRNAHSALGATGVKNLSVGAGWTFWEAFLREGASGARETLPSLEELHVHVQDAHGQSTDQEPFVLFGAFLRQHNTIERFKCDARGIHGHRAEAIVYAIATHPSLVEVTLRLDSSPLEIATILLIVKNLRLTRFYLVLKEFQNTAGTLLLLDALSRRNEPLDFALFGGPRGGFGFYCGRGELTLTDFKSESLAVMLDFVANNSMVSQVYLEGHGDVDDTVAEMMISAWSGVARDLHVRMEMCVFINDATLSRLNRKTGTVTWEAWRGSENET